MRTILGLLFFMTVPWLLLAAIPLVFVLIEAAPLFIPIALIGVGASVLRYKYR